MGLKKRAKVSAEFNMSSLTDIIFLLLIFFMLTSTLVKIQPFELPKSDSKTVAPISVVVALNNQGDILVDDAASSFSRLKSDIRTQLAATGEKKKDNTTVTIVAEVGTPFDDVVKVMDIAAQLKLRAIIATEPTKK